MINDLWIMPPVKMTDTQTLPMDDDHPRFIDAKHQVCVQQVLGTIHGMKMIIWIQKQRICC